MIGYVMAAKTMLGSLAGPYEDIPLSKILPQIDYEVTQPAKSMIGAEADRI